MNDTIDREKEFCKVLRDYLARFSEGRPGGGEPVVPIVRISDGTIDPEKTLALECYAGLKAEAEQGFSDLCDGLAEIATRTRKKLGQSAT